jgi:hypothetical protein
MGTTYNKARHMYESMSSSPLDSVFRAACLSLFRTSLGGKLPSVKSYLARQMVSGMGGVDMGLLLDISRH